VSQLTLYNAGSRAQPLPDEIFVGSRIGRHDVGPVPSPGGGPETRMLCRRAKRDAGSGDPAYSFPAATKDALAMRPFPRKQDPCGVFGQPLNRLQARPLGTATVPVAPVGVSPTESPSLPSTLSTLRRATQDGRAASTEDGLFASV